MGNRLKISSAAAKDPVTLAEAKLHLRVDHSADDDLITTLITAATKWGEAYTKRAFISQTWDMILDCFPNDETIIYLPKSPIQSITSIKYNDTDGNEQTLATTVYTYDTTTSVPARIFLKESQEWPDTQDQGNAVTIKFVTGYGDDETDVPAPILAAIKLLIGHWYDQREAASSLSYKEVPMAVESLMNTEKIFETVVEP